MDDINKIIKKLGQRPILVGQSGEASTYGWGEKLNKHTANGEVFNPMDLTAASYQYPANSMVKVIDKKTGKSVVVRINDLGPNKRLNRPIDLSQGAWRALGYNRPGLTEVDIEPINE